MRLKNKDGRDIEHLRIRPEDIETIVYPDDSPEVIAETKRLAEEDFGGAIPDYVHITSAVRVVNIIKQSTYDRIRGRTVKKKISRTLEYYFTDTTLIESLVARFNNIGGREFVVLLLALDASGIIQIPERGKNSMYECFRAKFRNIGTDSGINTYLSAYLYSKDIPGKQGITKAEVSKMQQTLNDLAP